MNIGTHTFSLSHSCSLPLLSPLLSTSLSQLDDDSLQKYCLKLESFLKHDVYYDIDGIDLFSELKFLNEISQIKEYTPIDILNSIKRVRFISKYMHCLQNFTNNTCYSCFCRKKFFKIKKNKIIFKIDNVPRKIKWISYTINCK